jgi:hypothetical protein
MLLRDPTVAFDGLGSFFAGDRGVRLAALVGDSEARVFSRAFLETLTENTLNQLVTGEGVNGWRTLSIVLGDLPMYENLVAKLQVALSALDLISILRKDLHVGLSAMRVAAAQVAGLRLHELRPFLCEQWRKAAVELADQLTHDIRDHGRKEVEDADAIVISLLDTAFALASSSGSTEAAISESAELLSKLIGFPDVKAASAIRAVIERLCTELPPDQSAPFWPLLVRLRTEKHRNPLGRGGT